MNRKTTVRCAVWGFIAIAVVAVIGYRCIPLPQEDVLPFPDRWAQGNYWDVSFDPYELANVRTGEKSNGVLMTIISGTTKTHVMACCGQENPPESNLELLYLLTKTNQPEVQGVLDHIKKYPNPIRIRGKFYGRSEYECVLYGYGPPYCEDVESSKMVAGHNTGD